MFTKQLINRAKMPTRHIVVCEDRIVIQARIAKHFSELFEDQGTVDVSFVRGGIEGSLIIQSGEVDLVLLDHDMPNGGGNELLKWMKENNKNMPVITFSGIPFNNERLMSLGANYLFSKEDVINGLADEIILEIVK